MSIKQCRAVQAVAEHGSFAAAARALNVAQSAVSMQVASFEESLGVTLFDRSHRPPRLTETGRLMVAHARAVVAEYERMRDAARQGQADGGTLRLGVIPTALTNLLPAALLALRKRARPPGLTIASALSRELVADIEDGGLDAALVHEPDRVATGLAWRPVARQRLVVVAPAASPETRLDALFAAHPYIRFNRAASVAPMIERRLAELGLAPRAHAEIQSIEAIRLLIGLGFGVSVLPDVPTPLDRGRLRTLAFGEPPLFRQIGFLMRDGLARRPMAETLVSVFAEAAGAPPPG